MIKLLVANNITDKSVFRKTYILASNTILSIIVFKV